MKVESDVNVLSEEVHIQSGFSVKKADPEVSLVSGAF
jgi:hypothetical protein